LRHDIPDPSLYLKVNTPHVNCRRRRGLAYGRRLPSTFLLSAGPTHTYVSGLDPIGGPIKARDVNHTLVELEMLGENALEEVNVGKRCAVLADPAGGGPGGQKLEACASALPARLLTLLDVRRVSDDAEVESGLGVKLHGT
jgi:hypothetical protein